MVVVKFKFPLSVIRMRRLSAILLQFGVKNPIALYKSTKLFRYLL